MWYKILFLTNLVFLILCCHQGVEVITKDEYESIDPYNYPLDTINDSLESLGDYNDLFETGNHDGNSVEDVNSLTDESIVDDTKDTFYPKDELEIRDIGDLPPRNCVSPCDCYSGEVCNYGKCMYYKEASEPLVFCCTDPECPEGYDCILPNGSSFAKCKSAGFDVNYYSDREDLDSEIKDISTQDIEDYRDTSIVQDTWQNQECIVKTVYFWDCSGCPGGRELSPTGRVYRFNKWRYNQREYLIVSNYTSANFYDVTDPENPILTIQGAAYTPWGIMEGSPDDDTEQWDIALFPENLTGLSMFMNFGWVTFSITLDSKGKPAGFSEPLQRYRVKAPPYIPTSRGAKGAILFKGLDQKIYAAAPYLAQQNSTGGIDIADMSNPSSIKVVSTLPDTVAPSHIRKVEINNTTYLVTPALYYDSIIIFKMENPAQPNEMSRILLCDNSTISRIYDFDTHNYYLYVVYRPTSSSESQAAIYDLSDPSSPKRLLFISNLDWRYNNVTGYDNYIIISSSHNETPELPIQIYSTKFPNKPFKFHIEPPNNDWLEETELDTIVYYNSSSNIVFYRAANIRASYSIIPKICLEN